MSSASDGDATVALDRDVLLVEDSEVDVRLVREAFDELGRTVGVVRDGRAAIEALSTLAERMEAGARHVGPSVILLDLNLPGASGMEVLRRLKGDPDLASVPVIVLSNSRADRDVAEAYGACANAFVTKPTGLDEFVETMEAIDRFWLRAARLP